MSDEEKHETVTNIPDGSSLPFDLSDEAPSFQKLADVVGGELPNTFAYVDDIIVFSPNSDKQVTPIFGKEASSNSKEDDAVEKLFKSLKITKRTWEFGSSGIKPEPPPDVEPLIQFILSLEDSPAPEGYTYATGRISCKPITKFNRSIQVKLLTWFNNTSEEDIQVEFFQRTTNSSWKRKDSGTLTDDQFIDVEIIKFDNLTAFLPRSLLPKVNIVVRPLMYYNYKGKIVVAFCVNNDIVETLCTKSLLKMKLAQTMKDVKYMKVAVGNRILYELSSKIKDRSRSEFIGEIAIDESFLRVLKGQVAAYKVMIAPMEYTYTLRQTRRGDVVEELDYPVSLPIKDLGQPLLEHID